MVNAARRGRRRIAAAVACASAARLLGVRVLFWVFFEALAPVAGTACLRGMMIDCWCLLSVVVVLSLWMPALLALAFLIFSIFLNAALRLRLRRLRGNHVET